MNCMICSTATGGDGRTWTNMDDEYFHIECLIKSTKEHMAEAGYYYLMFKEFKDGKRSLADLVTFIDQVIASEERKVGRVAAEMMEQLNKDTVELADMVEALAITVMVYGKDEKVVDKSLLTFAKMNRDMIRMIMSRGVDPEKLVKIEPS